MTFEKTLSDVTECYRLIGATEAKKGFGCFTEYDARFLRSMYETGLKHEKELRAENTTLKAELAAAKEADLLLRNLLCVIHRDGGHHITAHGLDQSVQDAMEVFYNLRDLPEQLAEAKKDVDRLTWLEDHDKRFYNIDNIAAIVGTGFSCSGYKTRHTELRSAIDEAMKGK